MFRFSPEEPFSGVCVRPSVRFSALNVLFLYMCYLVQVVFALGLSSSADSALSYHGQWCTYLYIGAPLVLALMGVKK